MGTMANELSLGCDCLGQIHYLVREPEHAVKIGVYLTTKDTNTAWFLYCT